MSRGVGHYLRRRANKSPRGYWATFLQGPHHCHYCNTPLADEEVTYDHKVPRSRGGGLTVNNLVKACQPCNRKKATTSYDEFIRMQ